MTSASDSIGWPLPDRWLLEVGRIGASFASLENFLNTCLGKLAGFDQFFHPVATILIHHSSFPQRLDMLASLCEHRIDTYPHLATYKLVVTKLKAAQRARNDFLHNVISLEESDSPNEAVILKASARGNLKMTTTKVELRDLQQASLVIDDAFKSLYELVLRQKLPRRTID
jgi:hypothetical protein